MYGCSLKEKSTIKANEEVKDRFEIEEVRNNAWGLNTYIMKDIETNKEYIVIEKEGIFGYSVSITQLGE